MRGRVYVREYGGDLGLGFGFIIFIFFKRTLINAQMVLHVSQVSNLSRKLST
ncbi:hypothetical protein HanRHA438_Chr09g0382301 [Helianthus annuus]|nr:hypothetical protein HanRHA438_Chr09g0382301 [Helianthus annuus]